MTCPEEQVREATSPEGASVDFDAPKPTGGREPYTVACTPGSGSLFPIGESIVDCKVTDADLTQATCGFIVRVKVSQTLAHTKFLAYGDSMTAGVTSLSPMIRLDPPDTYPYKLEQMLLQSYPSQPITVHNGGKSGDHVEEGAERLPSVLAATTPDVMLLLMGINGINGFSTSRQLRGIRDMVTTAQAVGVEVIIATVMPVTPAWRLYLPTTPGKIHDLNAGIVQVAAQFGLGNVVDLHALFEANIYLIGQDGLHPTREGQTRIAEAFRDEIVRRYETHATMRPR